MAKKLKTKRTGKSFLVNFGFALAFLVFAVACTAYIVTTQNEIAKKEEELAELQTKVDAAQNLNGEYDIILNGDGFGDYMEKLAIDELGYAYPDEIRFYDTNRN